MRTRGRYQPINSRKQFPFGVALPAETKALEEINLTLPSNLPFPHTVVVVTAIMNCDITFLPGPTPLATCQLATRDAVRPSGSTSILYLYHSSFRVSHSTGVTGQHLHLNGV